MLLMSAATFYIEIYNYFFNLMQNLCDSLYAESFQSITMKDRLKTLSRI